MEKQSLVNAVSECRRDWESMLSEVGSEGMEKPGACGDWSVRDTLAHIKAWNRWQIVQLASAFTGRVPAEEEMTGSITYEEIEGPRTEDAMNAMFIAGNRDLSLEEVVSDWREVSDLREAWVGAATQEQLDAEVGSDWAGTPGRYLRLVVEVPAVASPKSAVAWITEQLDHERTHLQEIHDWMRS